MRVCLSLQICLYMVKVVRRQVHAYMCVHVSPCECVFEFVYVFLYGEGCA